MTVTSALVQTLLSLIALAETKLKIQKNHILLKLRE